MHTHLTMYVGGVSNPSFPYEAWLRRPVLLVEVESPGGGGDADVPLLHRHHVQVHEVTVHLPVPRRGVPATHGEDLQAQRGLGGTTIQITIITIIIIIRCEWKRGK